jgi:hypothetical protein
MTTETKAPTKEEVEQDADAADGADGAAAKKAIARLKSAALLGTQVPGLVADNAALMMKGRALHDAASLALNGLDYGGRRDALVEALSANHFPPICAAETCSSCGGRGVDVDTDEEGGTRNERHFPCSHCKGSGRSSPGAALLAEHQRDVSALQARVVTLTAERDAAQALAEDNEALVRAWSDALGLGVGAGYNEAEVIRAECDALRAQVEQAKSIASGVISRIQDDVAGIICRDILAALSATPAETPVLILCPNCEQHHPGPTNPCVLCEAGEAYSAEQSAKADEEMAAEAETAAPERCEGCTAPAAAYDSEGAALCDTCMGAEAKK